MWNSRGLLFVHTIFFRESLTKKFPLERKMHEKYECRKKIKAENLHTEVKCSFSWETRTRQSVFQMPTNIFMPVRFWIAFKNVQMCWENFNFFPHTFSSLIVREEEEEKWWWWPHLRERVRVKKRGTIEEDEKKSIFNHREKIMLSEKLKKVRNWDEKILWIKILCKFFVIAKKNYNSGKKKVKNWIFTLEIFKSAGEHK